jgi:hypothetical protein
MVQLIELIGGRILESTFLQEPLSVLNVVSIYVLLATHQDGINFDLAEVNLGWGVLPPLLHVDFWTPVVSCELL